MSIDLRAKLEQKVSSSFLFNKLPPSLFKSIKVYGLYNVLLYNMQFKYHLKLKSSFILMTAYVLGVVRGNLGYFQKPKISFTPPPLRCSVNFFS